MKQEIFALKDRLVFPINFLPIFFAGPHSVCSETPERLLQMLRGKQKKRTDGLFPRSDHRNILMIYLAKKMKELEGLEKSY